jgi:hypothetical protein
MIPPETAPYLRRERRVQFHRKTQRTRQNEEKKPVFNLVFPFPIKNTPAQHYRMRSKG